MSACVSILTVFSAFESPQPGLRYLGIEKVVGLSPTSVRGIDRLFLDHCLRKEQSAARTLLSTAQRYLLQ